MLRGTTISVQYLRIIHNALASVPVWCQSPNTTFPQSFPNELTSKNHSSKYYKTALILYQEILEYHTSPKSVNAVFNKILCLKQFPSVQIRKTLWSKQLQNSFSWTTLVGHNSVHYMVQSKHVQVCLGKDLQNIYLTHRITE